MACPLRLFLFCVVCGGVRAWTRCRGRERSTVDAESRGLRHSEGCASTLPRTRTQRSGSRPKRRSKGADEAFAVRRKQSRADFATTQSPCGGAWQCVVSGRGRVALSSVILAKRESHMEGGKVPRQWTRRATSTTVILTKRGSPGQGRQSAISFPRRSRLGDSRAERENDSVFSELVSLPRQNQRGDSSPAAQALNDSR